MLFAEQRMGREVLEVQEGVQAVQLADRYDSALQQAGRFSKSYDSTTLQQAHFGSRHIIRLFSRPPVTRALCLLHHAPQPLYTPSTVPLCLVPLASRPMLDYTGGGAGLDRGLQLGRHARAPRHHSGGQRGVPQRGRHLPGPGHQGRGAHRVRAGRAGGSAAGGSGMGLDRWQAHSARCTLKLQPGDQWQALAAYLELETPLHDPHDWAGPHVDSVLYMLGIAAMKSKRLDNVVQGFLRRIQEASSSTRACQLKHWQEGGHGQCGEVASRMHGNGGLHPPLTNPHHVLRMVVSHAQARAHRSVALLQDARKDADAARLREQVVVKVSLGHDADDHSANRVNVQVNTPEEAALCSALFYPES